MGYRLAVFIDCMNTYHGARKSFATQHSPYHFGFTRPYLLGLEAQKRIPESELVLCSVYASSGIADRPTNVLSEIINESRFESWRSDNKDVVRINTLPLERTSDGTAKEKGVDVKLAVDFVAGALRDEYDIGMIFTEDRDFLPALRFVHDMPKKFALTGIWTSRERISYGHTMPEFACERFKKGSFLRCADNENYLSEAFVRSKESRR